MKREGFTLIELLIVVAILAMLAAILLPALVRAKDAAHTATCLSNQRQAHVAVTLYADDYDGYLPRISRHVDHRWQVSRGDPFDANTWQEALGRLYVAADFPLNVIDWGGGRALIFECASADKWRRYKVSEGHTNFRHDDYGVDFGISNEAVRIHWSDGHTPRPIRLSSVTERFIYIADTVSITNFANVNNATYGVRSSHSMDRASNFMFIDGSGETSKEYGLAPNMDDKPWNNPYWD